MNLTDEKESTKTTTGSKHQGYGRNFPKRILLALLRVITDSLFVFLVMWSVVLVAAGYVVRHTGIESQTYGYFVWYGTIAVFAVFCLYDFTRHK